MSTMDTFKRLNLMEAAKREGYTDSLTLLANMAQKNDLIAYAPWLPANNGLFHKYLQATALGKGGFKAINAPVPVITSKAAPVTENIFFYEGDSVVDEDLLKGCTGETARKVRDSEDAMNSEGFLQDWNKQIVYGTNAPNGFTCLKDRRNKLAAGACYSAGGSTANSQSSLYLFEFGEQGFNFRYASGDAPGLSTEDRGLKYIAAPTGTGNFWAWVRHMTLSGGMEIKTNKALMRLANIESLSDFTSTGLPNFIKMKNQLPNVGRGAMGFCNRTVHALIETNAYNKTNAAYSVKEIEGFGPITMIVGIPIMLMEAITDTEAVVS